MDRPSIPDDLLVDIFLRLPTPSDLIRASAACVSFRRLVADRSFLRRFRKLHAPPLLGFLDQHCFHPAIPPHPSAPAASAVALAADFSFSFLPSISWQWSVRDVRDGRVLLDRPCQYDVGEGRRALFAEIVVCDPLHRQYHLLPPIPDDLAASVENPLRIDLRRWGEAFLVPPSDDEADDMEETSFRVIWMAQCRAKPVAFAYCSGTGQWRAIPSLSWTGLVPAYLFSAQMAPFSCRQYAYGCFYWMTNLSEKFLVLDSCRMEFSLVESPQVARSGGSVAIVEAGDGMTGIFVHGLGLSADGTFSLGAHGRFGIRYTIWRNNGECSTEWQMEKTISMGSMFEFMGSIGRHLLLYQCGSSLVERGCFTLDIKTFQLEMVCAARPIPKSHAYCNFPPSILSSPTVSSGVEYVEPPRRRRKPVGPGHGLLQDPLQGIEYLRPFTGHDDQQGLCDAVPVPELREAGPGGVQSPEQESPAGHRRASAVFTVAAHAPNSVFLADVEAGLVDEEVLMLNLRRMRGRLVELETTHKVMRGQTKVSRATDKGAS